jgi:hypothetical protein
MYQIIKSLEPHGYKMFNLTASYPIEQFECESSDVSMRAMRASAANHTVSDPIEAAPIEAPAHILNEMLEASGFFLGVEYESNIELALAALMSVPPDRLSNNIIAKAMAHDNVKVRACLLSRHDVAIPPSIIESSLASPNREIRIAALCRPDLKLSSLAVMDMISTERDPATLVAMIGRGLSVLPSGSGPLNGDRIAR